ncbi:MAG TPA: SDR family NAD(P)-dependent oxidoreductase [Dehalococcoidia bacterium]|nr:SDR family NAD(P)-dependent oxidoreductase [Dehalococcoidia bacterium]
MPDGWLEGKTAIVTGSGRGIGRGIALMMAKEGANVVVVDPGFNLDGSGGESGPAAEVVAEIEKAGGKAVPCLESVATVEGGENIIKTALDNFNRVDIVVNVAGILRDRMIFNMSPEEWQAVIAVHLKGHYNTIKPASVLMRQQRWGRIINFSSSSGLTGNAGQANYGAAKAGIAGLTRVIARDLGRYGVTCNAIAPSAATRMTQSVPDSARQLRARAGIQSAGGGALAGGTSESNAPAATQAAPSTNLRDPDLIAPMVCFLATDFAWNVNGQIFAVAGGSVSVLNHPLAYKTIMKQGMWSMDELDEMVPRALMGGTSNPAPPPADLEIPGRAVQAQA